MASPIPPSSPSSLPASSTSPAPAPIPPPVPVETHPNRTGLKPPPPQRPPPDPSRLAPEDAYYAHSPPRFRPYVANNNHAATLRLLNGNVATPAAVAALRPPPAVPGEEIKRVKDSRRDRATSRRRKRKGAWKKLLWVKQTYPDNYTDIETFLDHLQRNPRLRPYDFWPLVAESTVVVQHVCSVVIFVCCFTGIFQERVSPVSVVGWATICTVLGWVLWDFWVAKEQEEAARLALATEAGETNNGSTSTSSNSSSARNSYSASNEASKDSSSQGLGLRLSMSNLGQPPRRQGSGLSSHSHSTSAASANSAHSANSPISPITLNPLTNGHLNFPTSLNFASGGHHSSFSPSSILSSRNHQRIATTKSALLIFCALLGLSPILKSLTKSTTSDSIWAMSCWLIIINIFFFDYGSGEGANAAKFPASLSTNAAVMASTVLASRLKSTTHVFSLTLFSIEVFGLFPVFRRHLRAISWEGHVMLTVSLVVVASAAVGITLRGGYMSAILGILIGGIATALIMGGCSWWLIGLQKYKNVVTGPWDPARPILSRHWD
ncbi:hypothetical protein AJ80_06405 [Polytolypa hystricis UAMH7299]|uniref:Phosphatidylinositol N-acetylglucosaminyltransferase subunit C n=1 Tax=Polytolypa hystricis (strain UAMH7299) TaxID=1447883 RepID=A0A2B7XNE4_POLH7|nr:hypothetical protein AJ80_06405 [Polytolypa hystricis UAMH7299]